MKGPLVRNRIYIVNTTLSAGNILRTEDSMTAGPLFVLLELQA